MLDKIPSPEPLRTLVGNSFFELWEQLRARIEEKYDMEWNVCGTRAEKPGPMNANTAAAEKLCAPYTQEKTASDL